MTNIYLEKIALTIEDTRAARQKSDSAERGVRAKGAAIGAGVLGAAGGGLGYKFGKNLHDHPVHGYAAKASGLTPKKLRTGVAIASAALGAINGAVLGEQSSYESARAKKYGVHQKVLNRALTKSAAVTLDQVKKRVDRNDAVKEATRAGGFVAGGLGTGAVAGGVGIHKGMRATGGYTAVKDALKNSYNRRKSNPETKIGKGSYLTKLEDMKPSRGVAKHIDRSGIARGVGNAFGKTMARGGLAAAAVGAIAGGTAASRYAKKRTDASDVSYYQKLSKRNG